VQAAIVARAKALGVMPRLEVTPANGKKVAIVGSGAAGLAAALVLAQLGYEVDVLDRQARPGGAARLIPAHRMDPQVLDTDIAWLLEHPRVRLLANRPVDDAGAQLPQGYAAVLVTCGLHEPMRLGIQGESWRSPAPLRSRRYVGSGRWRARQRVAIGGGAIACDAPKLRGAHGARGRDDHARAVGELRSARSARPPSIRSSRAARAAAIPAQAGRVSGLASASHSRRARRSILKMAPVPDRASPPGIVRPSSPSAIGVFKAVRPDLLRG
jgi:NADPH-dependent glutamate synthase beta subunit-like oxidoreductase